jgi:hypothetical protein
MEMQVIRGPTAQLTSGDILYQVTLATGAIVTNQAAFEKPIPISAQPTSIVTIGGQVLVQPKTE